MGSFGGRGAIQGLYGSGVSQKSFLVFFNNPATISCLAM